MKLPLFYTYAITDPEFYGDNPLSFEKNLREVLKTHTIDILCFRDKRTKDIEPLAKICLSVGREFSINKILLNQNIELASTLGFDGAHLTSQQYDMIEKSKNLGLYTLASAHSSEDLELIKSKYANGATYSPIFYKKNKGEPKGCENLTKIVEKYQEDTFSIFALGGITSLKNVEEVKQTNCKGFASIGYFTKSLTSL